MYEATILVCLFYSPILSLTWVAIDDPEFGCSGSGQGTPQDQEYFKNIADLQ